MDILYFSAANLGDRLFIRNFATAFAEQKAPSKTLIFHAPAPTVSQTRDLTKRLSWLLSEAMVYNNAVGADQRNIFRATPGGIVVKKDIILSLIAPIPVLLVGPLLQNEQGEAMPVHPLALMQAAKAAFDSGRVTLFAENPQSPMISQPVTIASQDDRDRLLRLYEEEQATIDMAFALRPARITGAR